MTPPRRRPTRPPQSRQTPSLFDEPQIALAHDLRALLDGGYIVAVDDGPQTRFAPMDAPASAPQVRQTTNDASRRPTAPQEVHA